MLKSWLDLLEKNCLMVISLQNLSRTMQLRGNPKAASLSSRLSEEIEAPLRRIPQPLTRLLDEQGESERSLSEKDQRDVSSIVKSVFKYLRNSIQAYPKMQSDDMQSSEGRSSDGQSKEPVTEWLDKAVELNLTQQGFSFMPPAPNWSPTPGAIARLVQLQSQACFAWPQWRESFRRLARDEGAIERTGQFDKLLGAIAKQIGSQRAKTGGDSEDGALVEGFASLISAFQKITDDLKIRLQDKALHALGNEVLEEVEEADRNFRAFTYGNIVAGLAREWDENKCVRADDFLYKNWGQGISTCSDSGELRKPAVPVIVSLCEFFDALPGADEPVSDEKLIVPLKRCMDQLAKIEGTQVGLIVGSNDRDMSSEFSCEVTRPKRKSTGVFMEVDSERKIVRKGIMLNPTYASRLAESLRTAQQRSSATDPLLADACSELAEALVGNDTLESWLANDPSSRAGTELLEGNVVADNAPSRPQVIWRLAHLALTSGTDSGDSVVKALEILGAVRFEEVTGNALETTAPCWMIRRLKHTDKPIERTRMWLTLPGVSLQKLSPPAIATIGDHESISSFCSAWQQIQPLLQELKFRSPNDNLWNELEECFLAGLFRIHGEPDITASVGVCNYLQRYVSRSSPPEKNIASRALQSIHNEFQRQGCEILPRFDSDFKLQPASKQPVDRVRISWERSDEPAGTVLSVEKFGAISEPAQVVASGGKDLPAFVGEYFNIPQFESIELLDLKLQDDRAALSLKVRDAAKITTSVKKQLESASQWLAAENANWDLDAWLKSVCNGDGKTETSRQTWYGLLQEQCSVQIYPLLNLQSASVLVTSEMIARSAKIEWSFNDTVPFGTAIEIDSVRFAVTASDARGSFSYGPRKPGTVLDDIETIRHLFEESLVGTDHDGFATQLGSLTTAFRDRELQRLLGNTSAASESLHQHLAHALDGLAGAVKLSPQRLDQILAGLRRLARLHGSEIEPRDWSFQNPSSAEVCLEFHKQVNRKLTENEKWVITFGLRSESDYQPAFIKRYVGPAPPGWIELRNLVKQLPSSCQSTFKDHLDKWPAAFEKRNLIQQIVALHRAWYDEIREGFVESNPKLEKDVSAALEKVVVGQHLALFMKAPNDVLPQARAQSVEEEHILGSQSHQLVKRPGIWDESNTIHCKARLLTHTSS